MDNHAYCKLLSLIEYIALTKKRKHHADVKRRHKKKMEGKVFQEFLNHLTTNITNTSTETNIAVQLVLWSDGFEPNQSVKRNWKGAWILTVTFFFYEISTKALYMVDSNLLAGGPGKKGDGSEDHTVIMKELYSELQSFIDLLTKKSENGLSNYACNTVDL